MSIMQTSPHTGLCILGEVLANVTDGTCILHKFPATKSEPPLGLEGSFPHWAIYRRFVHQEVIMRVP